MAAIDRFVILFTVLAYTSSFAESREIGSNELRLLSRQARETHECSPAACYIECKYGNKLDDDNCPLCECRTQEEVCGTTRRCRNYCPSGYKEDERGCETCECATSSSRGGSSRKSSWHSRRSSSNSRTSSRHNKCDDVQCTMHCEHGFKKNYRGCDICQCADAPTQEPVESIRQSSSGRKYPAQLPAETSSKTSRTISKCSRIKCDKSCKYGFAKDSFGCSICACRSRRQPLRESCDNRPACLMHCEHGYVKGSDGCDTCACREAPTTTKVCAMCLMYCEHGMKPGPDGCPLCECNPAPTSS